MRRISIGPELFLAGLLLVLSSGCPESVVDDNSGVRFDASVLTDLGNDSSDLTTDSGNGIADISSDIEYDVPLYNPDTTADTNGADINPIYESCVYVSPEDCETVYDDDCDGYVNEACGCSGDTTVACYPGDTIHLEAEATHCRVGTQTCQIEFFGACEGFLGPLDEEICGNAIDDDCDGRLNEGCVEESPSCTLPVPDQYPVLRSHTFTAAYFDPSNSPMVGANWRFETPFGSSRDISMDGLTVDFFADVLGDFTFTLIVTNTEGLEGMCSTTFTAHSDDVFTVEMSWNPTWDVDALGADTTDLDLLVHRLPDDDFEYWNYLTNRRNDEVCYWLTCSTCPSCVCRDDPDTSDDDAEFAECVSSGDCLFEGDPVYQPSESEIEIACRDYLSNPPTGLPEDEIWPPPVLVWGSEEDTSTHPRLDLDDREGRGPENINILVPEGATYRVAVHYFDGGVRLEGNQGPPTPTSVRVLCADACWQFEDIVLRTNGLIMGTGREFNDLWELGDLTVSYDGGEPTCELELFGDPSDDCPRICALNQANAGPGCGIEDCEPVVPIVLTAEDSNCE